MISTIISYYWPNWPQLDIITNHWSVLIFVAELVITILIERHFQPASTGRRHRTATGKRQRTADGIERHRPALWICRRTAPADGNRPFSQCRPCHIVNYVPENLNLIHVLLIENIKYLYYTNTMYLTVSIRYGFVKTIVDV